MSRNLTLPSNRLYAAAETAAVPLYKGETADLRAIDVGCDHAKLAIYLVQSGICSHVTASDINEGPVARAKQNIERRTLRGKPLSELIDVVCTDGLSGLEKIDANRIFILGMGGELIGNILEKADFLKSDDKKRKIGFILQPMTSEYDLRVYLYTCGFEIIDEKLVLDKGRIYPIIYAAYDGIQRTATGAELLLGKHNIIKGGELFDKVLKRRTDTLRRAADERKSGGLDSKELETLLEELNKIKEDKVCTVSEI